MKIPVDQIQQELRIPTLFRIINILGSLVLLFMAFLGWMAYSQEEVSWGLPSAVIMLVIGLGWLFGGSTSMYKRITTWNTIYIARLSAFGMGGGFTPGNTG